MLGQLQPGVSPTRMGELALPAKGLKGTEYTASGQTTWHNIAEKQPSNIS